MLFVQHIHGMFYINPTFYGKTWTLALTEEEEVVYIKTYPKTSQQSARRRAYKVLKQSNIFCKIVDYEGKDVVPINGTMQPVMIFKVELIDPIPTPDYDEGRVNQPPLEHPFRAWEMVFDQDAVQSVLIETKQMNPLLLKFLTGDPYFKDRKKVKRLLKNVSKHDKVRLESKTLGRRSPYASV
jgi:hypothetical protein